MAHVTASSPNGHLAARGWARGSVGLLGALDRWALPTLLLLMAAYVVVFTAMAIARLDAFRQGFDLVSYLQPIWNTSQGRPYEQSIYAGASTILGIDLFWIEGALALPYALAAELCHLVRHPDDRHGARRAGRLPDRPGRARQPHGGAAGRLPLPRELHDPERDAVRVPAAPDRRDGAPVRLLAPAAGPNRRLLAGGRRRAQRAAGRGARRRHARPLRRPPAAALAARLGAAGRRRRLLAARHPGDRPGAAAGRVVPVPLLLLLAGRHAGGDPDDPAHPPRLRPDQCADAREAALHAPPPLAGGRTGAAAAECAADGGADLSPSTCSAGNRRRSASTTTTRS